MSSPNKLNTTHQVLLKLISNSLFDTKHHIVYTKKNIHIELHLQVFPIRENIPTSSRTYSFMPYISSSFIRGYRSSSFV